MACQNPAISISVVSATTLQNVKATARPMGSAGRALAMSLFVLVFQHVDLPQAILGTWIHRLIQVIARVCYQSFMFFS